MFQYGKEPWKEVKQLGEKEDKIPYLQYLSVVIKDKKNANKLTSFSCRNSLFTKKKTKMNPVTNFKSMSFNPFSNEKHLIENEHHPQVII